MYIVHTTCIWIYTYAYINIDTRIHGNTQKGAKLPTSPFPWRLEIMSPHFLVNPPFIASVFPHLDMAHATLHFIAYKLITISCCAARGNVLISCGHLAWGRIAASLLRAGGVPTRGLPTPWWRATRLTRACLGWAFPITLAMNIRPGVRRDMNLPGRAWLPRCCCAGR